MNSELAKIEEGKIVVAENVIKKINKFKKEKLQMDLMDEELRGTLLTLMEQVGADKYVSPNGTIIVNYYPERTTKRLDTTALKEEQKEIYEMYLKDSTTKSYVKITVK